MRKYFLLLAIAALLAGCKKEEPKPVLHPSLTPYLGDCNDEIDMSIPMASPAHITKEGDQDLRNYVVYNYMGEHQLRIVYHVAEFVGARIRMDAAVTGANIEISYTLRNTATEEGMCEYPLYFDFKEFPYFDYHLFVKGKEYPLYFQKGYGPDTIYVD